MGNVSARGKIFKWSIEGYSSIEKNVKSKYYSGFFEALGYRWRMILLPHDKRHSDGKSFLRLGLYLDASPLPYNVVLKVDYKLGIYDEIHGRHVRRRGYKHFSHMDYAVLDVISMESFNSSANGFIVNDGCFFSAEITNVVPVTLRIGASECFSVRTNVISYSGKWTIKNFSGIQKPIYSEDFEAGRLNWHLKLEKRVNCIALFLELDKSTTFPPNSGVNVEFTFHVMDQVKGNHKKRIDQLLICSKFVNWGWPNFLHLEDLQNPSNGFLVNDTCIVEASIAILGSSSYHDF